VAKGFESCGVMYSSEATAEREHLELVWSLRPHSHRMRAVARNSASPGLGDYFDLRPGDLYKQCEPVTHFMQATSIYSRLHASACGSTLHVSLK
jgi:hypothetical protein